MLGQVRNSAECRYSELIGNQASLCTASAIENCCPTLAGPQPSIQLLHPSQTLPRLLHSRCCLRRLRILLQAASLDC